MLDVFEFISQSLKSGKKVAVVTVTGTRGSSPASVGQMMAVLTDGSSKGTVGGGATEHKIIAKTVDAIKSGENTFTLTIDHAENGMICGGGMEVFGNIIGNHQGLCIFGGGHIAQCLAQIAVLSGFYVTVIEDRPEFASHFENANYIVCKPDEYKTNDPAGFADYAVICTRGHGTDDEALRYCLTQELKYIGMIGSKTKVNELFSMLRSEGIPQTVLDSIYAPVGLDIADAAPAEIAIAILAEILLIKNNGTLKHKKI